MRASRKTKVILAAILTCLLAGVIIGLHIFLVNDLADAIRTFVVPEANRRLGVNVSVDDAGVNLFTGAMRVSDVRAGNPPGFDEPSSFTLKRMKLDVGLRGLLFGIAHISKLRVDDADATIVRNKDGAVNLLVMRDCWDNQKTKQPKTGSTPSPSPPVPPSPEAGPGATSPSSAQPLPRLAIDDSTILTSLAYADYGLSDEVFRLTLKLALEAQGISTGESPRTDWGTLKIRGHLAENPRSFVINLQGKIAPLTDLNRPTFDLVGDIVEVDLSRMDAVSKKLGISSESVAMNVDLRCRNGEFESETSQVTIRLKKARPVGKLAKKLKGMPIQADLSIVVPVSGTIRKLEFDWEGALIRSAMENAASILKNIPDDNPLMDKKTTRALKELNRTLGQ